MLLQAIKYLASILIDGSNCSNRKPSFDDSFQCEKLANLSQSLLLDNPRSSSFWKGLDLSELGN